MEHNATQIEHRVMRYWYVDGFGELIGGGGMCLTLAVYFTLQQYFGEDTLIGSILQVSLVLVLLGGFFLVRRMIQLMKTRVTYPRTGFVEYRSGGQQKRVFVAVIAVTSALVFSITFTLLAKKVLVLDALVLVSGMVMAFILLVKQLFTTKVKRFYLLSVLALIVGVLLSFSGLPRGYNLGLFYGLIGAAFSVSGGLTLRKYLQENPLEPDNG